METDKQKDGEIELSKGNYLQVVSPSGWQISLQSTHESMQDLLLYLDTIYSSLFSNKKSKESVKYAG